MKVFSNLAVSLDGRIADARHPAKPLGTPYDRKLMEVIRAKADAVVIGAETLRACRDVIRGKKKRKQALVNVVVTRSGRIDPDLPFWDAKDVVRFVFTSNQGFEAALESARDRAFVIRSGDGGVDPKQLLARLKQSGLKNILVEGGGEIVSLFLSAGCLQEMYVTVTPWILGGAHNPTLSGHSDLPAWTKLKILKMKRVKEEVYFHYRVQGAKNV